MSVTLAQLLPPVTSDEAKALLLETLQGIGPVQQIGLGAGVLVVTGAPAAAYDAIVQIALGGAPGTATFNYSLDDGNTFSGPFSVPGGGQYIIFGSGLTLNFAGVFNATDQYLFQTIYPAFPVTDWESGSGGRTLVEADAATIADLSGTALPNIAAGGLVSYASGDWLTLLSDQVYEQDRFAAAGTIGIVQLTLAATAPALTINPGDIVVSNSSGSGVNVLTYSNMTGTTIMPGTSVVLAFQALAPGALFNVSNGTLIVLKTPKPGLTANNPAPGTSSVTHVGGGGGTVAVTGSPNGNYSVVVRVTTSGGLGVGAVQISLDGGNNYASPFTIPASGSYQVPVLNGLAQTGLTLTFAGSFVATDTYSFTAYNSWITTPGRNAETDSALQSRDIAQWTGLGYGGGTDKTFDYLCRTTPSGGSEVTKTQTLPDTSIAGQIDITVAGANGPISTSALAAITSYVKARIGICNSVSIANATVDTISVTAQVFCPSQALAAVQAAISTAFATLVANTPIGGVVTWASIEDALYQTQAGVTDLYLTVPAPNTDTQLPASNVVAFNLAGVSYVLS
jgi:uncharacterized phage protein gp47/JayE